MKAHGDTVAHPLRDALRTSRRTLLLGIGLRLGENGGSSIIGALAMSYIVGTVGLTGSIGAVSLVCAASLGAIVVPISGMLSDRFGRRIVYRSFAIFQVLTVFPMWYVLSRGDITSTLIVITIGLAVGVWGMFGTQGAYMPELFGARHRYVGVSLAREVSAVIAGGIAPLIGSVIIAWVISQHPGETNPGLSAWFPLACYQALLAVGTVITTFLAPETRGRDLTDPRDAVEQVDLSPSLATVLA